MEEPRDLIARHHLLLLNTSKKNLLNRRAWACVDPSTIVRLEMMIMIGSLWPGPNEQAPMINLLPRSYNEYIYIEHLFYHRRGAAAGNDNDSPGTVLQTSFHEIFNS